MNGGTAMYERPAWVRRINAMGDAIGGRGRDIVTIDATLLDTATTITGLDDYGDDDGWRDAFMKLVDALDTEAQLHLVGRLMCRHDLLRHLSTRLRVIDAAKRAPEIADEAITAPIVITGPARSGTSILQELLAQDPRLRCPLAWEMAYPTHPRDDAAPRRWTETEFDLWGDVQPEFLAIHEMDATLPEECLWLMAPAIDMGFWTTCTNIPSWFAWRASTDVAPVYRFHRRMLQTLQHVAPDEPRTWVLKSPVHLSRLAPIFAEYPDARVIHTHRDPVKTMPSSASAVYGGRWLRSDAIDPLPTGTMVGFGLQMSLDAVRAQRTSGAIPDDRIVDVHYLDLLRTPVDAMAALYERLGLTFRDEDADRIRAYLAARPQHKHGVHRYRAEDFGLDVTDLRTRFAPYVAHYGIEEE